MNELHGLAVRLIKKFPVTENNLYVIFYLLRVGFLNGFSQFYFSAGMLYVFVSYFLHSIHISYSYLISSSKTIVLKGYKL